MDKNMIVLVPGMFSLGSVYKEFKGELETLGRPVRVVDFPMKITPDGYSYSGPCETDFWDKLEYLLKILRSLNGPYDLGGHSAGALLALRAVEEDDINPGQLFLVSPAPPSRIFALYPSVLRSFWFVLSDPFFRSKSIWIPYKNFRWAMANTLSEERALELYRRLRPEAGEFIFEIGFPWVDPSRATRVDFKKINCPVAVFVGTEDRVTPMKVSRDLCEVLEDEGAEVRFFVLEGFCHWIIDSLCEKLASWIDDLNAIDSISDL